MRRLWNLVTGFLGVLFALSFCGALLPLGDSLAVLRVPLAIAFGLFVIWTNWPAYLRWTLALAACAALAQIIWLRHAEGVPGDLVVYQKNLRLSNPDVQRTADDILATDADVVTLQELSVMTTGILASLASRYSHQHVCEYPGSTATAVLSRWPLTEMRCPDIRGVTLARVGAPDPFTLVSLHLYWPFPYNQARQVRELERILSAEPGPIVIGGDFNIVPWSHSVAALERASGTERVGSVLQTMSLSRFQISLPIDHVLAPGGGTVDLRPRDRSDHRGVLARVSLSPA